uniref:Uncharacterized protein n=1 Tax=Arundo donax TaxID=35708 RepID=A0A0A9H9F0_ARUDO
MIESDIIFTTINLLRRSSS